MIIASDLEGTLTSGTTWKAVGRYLSQNGRQPAYRLFFVTHLPGVLLVRTRLMQAQAYRVSWMTDLARLFRGMTSAELVRMAAWVVDQELWPKRYPALVEELHTYQEQGRQVILVTGAYQPIAEVFAQRIGAVTLGTPLEMRNTRATGRLAYPINNGPYKTENLRAFLKGRTLDMAYGDSLADLPMLELSQTPVAVCPEAALQAIAVERGWRIVTP